MIRAPFLLLSLMMSCQQFSAQTISAGYGWFGDFFFRIAGAGERFAPVTHFAKDGFLVSYHHPFKENELMLSLDIARFNTGVSYKKFGLFTEKTIIHDDYMPSVSACWMHSFYKSERIRLAAGAGIALRFSVYSLKVTGKDWEQRTDGYYSFEYDIQSQRRFSLSGPLILKAEYQLNDGISLYLASCFQVGSFFSSSVNVEYTIESGSNLIEEGKATYRNNGSRASITLGFRFQLKHYSADE